MYCIFSCAALYPVAGDLDTTFNPGGAFPPGIPGIVTTDISTGNDAATSVVIQSDGKIVAAGLAFNSGTGFTDFALTRYLPNGALDTSFGGGGIVTTTIGAGDSFINGLALQTDGKLVAVGVSYNGLDTDFTLARYLPNGTLDPSFGFGGIVITDSSLTDDLRAVVIQPDGKIVVGGNSGPPNLGQFTVVRYLTNGTLDVTFGFGGIMVTPIEATSRVHSLALQPDGKIIAGGSSIGTTGNFALTRYLSNGFLDTSFGTGGIVITDISGDDLLTDIALHSNGKIVAVGITNAGTSGDMVVARYTATGTLDSSFGPAGTGIVIMDFAGTSDGLLAVTLQPDQKIVVAGIALLENTLQWILLRYTVCGFLDTTFHGTGFVITPILVDSAFLQLGLTLQSDGKIVVAGNSGDNSNDVFVVARYLNDSDINRFLVSPIIQAIQAKYCFCL